MNLAGGPAGIDGQTDRRLLAGVLLVVSVWLLLGARLFYLQVIEGDRYRISAERNSIRTHRVRAPRGMILDRNGVTLVDSRPAFDVRLVPYQNDAVEQTLDRVASLLEIEPASVRQAFGKPRGRQRFQPVLIAHDVDYQAAARVGARLWALPGVITQAEPVRSYPFGSSAAHVLGILGEIGPKELGSREFQGYRRGDIIGKDGVERLLDRALRGRDGGRNVLVDAYGRELERLDQVDAQPGRNVVLTLDSRLQQVAERKLDETGHNGAVVAIDPRNGEVLVLASRPAFDPNRFARGIGRREWQALVQDPRKPLHDRVVVGAYPPGSTYKVVPALAGLEKGVIGSDFKVECLGADRIHGQRFRCWKRGGHGLVDMHRAIVESCDVFFYRLGNVLGVDTLAYYARALGLGSPTGIELRRESPGLVPSREWKRRRYNEPWYPGETISVSIGQGSNLWTPIQMASAYATIANGGTRYRPMLIKRIEGPYGEVLEERLPEVVGTAPISRTSFEQVRAALRGVVHEPRGTASVMRNLPNGVEAAGKTGTAQVVSMPPAGAGPNDVPTHLEDHAWFATYLPADDPRIAIAVLVEHGGHGGSAAAPIARAVAETFLNSEVEHPEPSLPTPEQVAEHDRPLRVVNARN